MKTETEIQNMIDSLKYLQDDVCLSLVGQSANKIQIDALKWVLNKEGE